MLALVSKATCPTIYEKLPFLWEFSHFYGNIPIFIGIFPILLEISHFNENLKRACPRIKGNVSSNK
jgi:hypothetical protein